MIRIFNVHTYISTSIPTDVGARVHTGMKARGVRPRVSHQEKLDPHPGINAFEHGIFRSGKAPDADSLVRTRA